MRVSGLSSISGVPVATIKYYLREGLLHRGATTSPNQARYDDTHVRRLRLIRSLVEVGGLPIATVRDVLAAVDDPDTPVHAMLGKAVYAITADTDDDQDDHHDRAVAEVEAMLARNGWHVSEHAPARRSAASVLARMHRLGQERFTAKLDDYARAAERIAEADLAPVADLQDRGDRAEAALVGTVLGDALLAALRRMAQESFSAKHFPPTTDRE
ncbi:MerR family transcriptional regulator [Pseudonocardia sp. KRD291]|uniref:MerR family transcriptional regulator n=1 Tax=Pseudonocardia sp. KRD291 TaxID=2792007 RepID=UPI001C4A5BEC|nr:MerR family transcriptional regulator [Pseudonocardia sp. KRD291]MBW0104171.1 MerR family transcriptional regulator [Pseudonocardia sp. KRD291]